MLYHNVRVMAHALRFIDPVAVAVASVGAWLIGVNIGAWPASTAPAITTFALVNFFAFLALGSRLRIYHARRTEDVALELFVVCEVALYAAGLACIATQVFNRGLPGRAYLAALAGTLVALLALRLAMRLTIRGLRRTGQDYRVWLIVGHNDRSADLAAEILANPQFGIRIDEIVDLAGGPDRPDPSSPGLIREQQLHGVTVRLVPDVDALREIIATRVIDEVVVTLPVRSSYDTISEILEFCSGAGISVKLRPQAFETSGYRTEVSYVGNFPMITHYSGPSNYTHLLVKRLIDILGAAAGLVLLLPLFVFIAIAIKMNSPGPVFFRQTRVGLHGRHFEMKKFRSMVRDAPDLRPMVEQFNERDGTAFKIKADRRITSVGKVLRRYHLDELPQLWNVLVGDMSLVGPRPLPVKEAHGNEWWQRRRLTMPPGLTCFWQLEDNPNMPFLEWMRLDMAYIDRWSLWLDVKLIARTFATLVRGNGW